MYVSSHECAGLPDHTVEAHGVRLMMVKCIVVEGKLYWNKCMMMKMK